MSTPNTPGTGTRHAADPAAGGSGGGMKDQARHAAGTTADEGKRVADVARDQAQDVIRESQQQARNLMDEAMTQVDEQSRAQRDRLVSTLRSFGDDLERMTRGEQVSGGMAQDVTRQVADGARSLSSRMDGREPADLLDEVRSFARRRPGTFLLGALAAGVVAGRLTRGAKEAQSQGAHRVPEGGPEESARIYDDVRGTAAGEPTADTGRPGTPPAYPAGSAVEEPATTMEQDVSTTGMSRPAPAAEEPWTDEPVRRGTA